MRTIMSIFDAVAVIGVTFGGVLAFPVGMMGLSHNPADELRFLIVFCVFFASLGWLRVRGDE